MRAIVYPFTISDPSLPMQSLDDPPAPIEGADLDVMASMLRLGAAPAYWPSRADSSTKSLTFSTNKPTVLEEGGKRFVRFNDGPNYSSVGGGIGGIANGVGFTRYARVRFLDNLLTRIISSVYGSGTPNLYLNYRDGNPGISMHNGAQLTSTTPLEINTWYTIIAVFNHTESVLSINGVELTGNTGTASTNETGFTFGFRNGTGNAGRRWDLARGGHIPAPLDAAQRTALRTILDQA